MREVKPVLKLKSRCIIFRIKTQFPAEDTERYLRCLLWAAKELAMADVADERSGDVYTLLEFYEKLHPIPNEFELEERFGIS